MQGLNRTSLMMAIGVAVAALFPMAFVVPALLEEPAPPPKIVVPKRDKAPATVEAVPAAVVPPPAPAVVAPPPVPVGQVPGQVPVQVPNPSGADVLAVEQKLSQLGYLVGDVNGVMDAATKHGITAFQKYEGLERTGVMDAATTTRLQTAQKPTPKFTLPGNHIKVDIPRQILFQVRGGQTLAVVPTSTGNNKKFTSQGYTRRAVTPNGQFTISYKRNGWRKSPLGMLYRPAYFNGGIALHGSKSVPTGPASHGCVRIPMAFADWFLDNAPVGMTVYVYGGPTGPNPQPSLDDPGLGAAASVPAANPVAEVPAPAPPAPAAAPPAAAPAPPPFSGWVNPLSELLN
jgi:lipoprotein-anchoring transpeptidase ErfK/SrfK